MKKLARLLGTVLLLLSCSTVAMATPFLFALPEPYGGGGGGRYAFTWYGEIEGFEAGSPYAKFNGEKFTLSGFYLSNGTFDFTRMEVFLPPPEQGGPGSLVAMPDPVVCGPGCLALPNPDLGGGGGLISLIPRIEIDPLVPGSAPSARFLSLDFDGTATTPTISTYSYQSAPVPEPSTILLFAAGLAGLTAVRRRMRPSVADETDLVE